MDRIGVTPPNMDEVVQSQLAGKEFFFPAGLLGFAACRWYKLEPFNRGGGESPFWILSSLDRDLSFPLIHPASVSLEYRFPVSRDLLALLRAQSVEPLVPLLIVTVRDRLEQTTLNLQGPLIVNPSSSLGVQLVIEEYPLRFHLFKAG